MNAAIEAVWSLRIHGVSMQNKTPKRRLHVRAGAAEPVVKIEVPEGSVEVVAPKQVDHAPPEPHAFGVARRAGHGALRLGEFVHLLRLFAAVLSGRRRLLGRFGIAGLGESRRDAQGKKEPKRGARSADNAEYPKDHGSTCWALPGR